MDKRLTLSINDKMIGGVCGGLGEYFRVDSTLIRILVVLMSFIFLFLPIITIYIIFWIIIPKAKDTSNNKIYNEKYKDGFYDFSEFDDKK